jgi:sulfotransferase
MKNLYFISGLPRAGANLLSNILNQNPDFHTEPVSSLCDYFSHINNSWLKSKYNQVYSTENTKRNLLKSLLENYHDTDKFSVFDNNPNWVKNINLVEQILERSIKVICPVRNPAEILASFEKLRKSNPTRWSPADEALGEKSTIASRAYFYASPDGVLGTSHAMLLDAVTQGFLDRMLFIDYSRFCNSPRSQTKRIYEFFELSEFNHDFQNINQKIKVSEKYQHFYEIKSRLERATINCVEFLGLDLYQQYNREIFWNAWI